MSCRGSGWKAPALTALASPGICARRACQCWRWTARTGGARRAQGKSDPIDAYAAARAALSGRAVGLRQVDGMALAGPGSAGRFRPSGRPGREVALAQFAGRARARAVRLACFARPGKPFSVVTAHTFGVVSKPRRTLTNARSVSSTAMSPR